MCYSFSNMPCLSSDHNGLAIGSYSGPTHNIAQYAMWEALEPYGVVLNHLPQEQRRHQSVHMMQDWDVHYPGQVVGNTTFTLTSATFMLEALRGSVSIDLRADVAQKEPITRHGNVLSREYFDVSGCGALVTAACAFVAKSTPWEALATGGMIKISSKYTGNNLPDMRRPAHDAGVLPTWQSARPFGQPVKLSLRVDASSAAYDGRRGSEFSGGLYIAGSMSDLPKTAAAQVAVLSEVTENPAKAERTVSHAYGGTMDALREAWARALSAEAETPIEAARLAYTVLSQ